MRLFIQIMVAIITLSKPLLASEFEIEGRSFYVPIEKHKTRGHLIVDPQDPQRQRRVNLWLFSGGPDNVDNRSGNNMTAREESVVVVNAARWLKRHRLLLNELHAAHKLPDHMVSEIRVLNGAQGLTMAHQHLLNTGNNLSRYPGLDPSKVEHYLRTAREVEPLTIEDLPLLSEACRDLLGAKRCAVTL